MWIGSGLVSTYTKPVQCLPKLVGPIRLLSVGHVPKQSNLFVCLFVVFFLPPQFHKALPCSYTKAPIRSVLAEPWGREGITIMPLFAIGINNVKTEVVITKGQQKEEMVTTKECTADNNSYTWFLVILYFYFSQSPPRLGSAWLWS